MILLSPIEFCRVLRDRVGTRVLQEVLNREFENHIKATIPGFRRSLNEEKSRLHERLKKLGAFDFKSENALFDLSEDFVDLQFKMRQDVHCLNLFFS